MKVPQTTVAILPWGNVIEDYLEPIGLTLNDFTERMDGGWLFGYVESLQSAGSRVVIICFSVAVTSPERRRHHRTGASIVILPSTRTYRRIRAALDDPYAWSWRAAVRHRRGVARIGQLLRWGSAPYTCTPIGLLGRTLRREQCDVVLLQEYEEGRFDVLVLLGHLLRVPVFATFQGGNITRTPLEVIVRKRTMRAAAGLIVGAACEVDRLHSAYGIQPRNVHRIGNPLVATEVPTSESRAAARAELAVDEGAATVAWYGRVDIDAKGLDVLVEAWVQCCIARPHMALQLLLVGSGPDAERLRELLESSHAHNVQWRNEYVLDRSVLVDCLAASDVFAFPSRREGFAVAPMEAMAAQIPIVAANTSGVAELVGDENVGAVVPVGDSSAFAVALGRLLDDPDERRRCGVRARAVIIERYSVAAIGARLAAALVGAEED